MQVCVYRAGYTTHICFSKYTILGGIFLPVMTSQNMHSHLMSLRLMVIVSTWRFRCEDQYLSHVYASMELEPGIN